MSLRGVGGDLDRDDVDNDFIARAGHIFCRECIRQYLETSVENEIVSLALRLDAADYVAPR